MELFAIAHEYGHHHCSHGRRITDDAHGEEFEADRFALRICYEIERVAPVILPNPYLSSGAGGVALLSALGTLRRIEEVLFGARRESLDTHPVLHLRIDRLDSVATLRPQEFKALQSFRMVCKRILDAVDANLLDTLRMIPPETYRGISPVRFGLTDT